MALAKAWKTRGFFLLLCGHRVWLCKINIIYIDVVFTAEVKYTRHLSIPSLSTRIVPLRFQAGGCRRRPNLGLVCVLFCTLCYLYSLVKMYCGALFYLVYCFVCSFSALTLLVGSFDL